MRTFIIVFLVGIVSTLIMDIGGAIFRLSGLIAGTPPEFVGKWLQSAIHGHLFVRDIRYSGGEPVPLRTFLLYHYLIGITLTLIFYYVLNFSKILEFITPWTTLGYGILTTVIPAFLMFPGMGFGFFGFQGPPEYLLLRTAILNHLFFGVGLTITFYWFPGIRTLR